MARASVAFASWAVACGGSGERPPASTAADRPRSSPPACDLGAERDSRTLRRAIVLGCGRVPDGSRVELVTRDGTCLAIQGLRGGERACGVAPSLRSPRTPRPLGGPVFVRLSPRSRTELYGETSAEVRRVTVRYRHRGRTRRHRATLIEVRDDQTLRAAGIAEPFGYFVAFVPAAARDVVAEAHGAGRRLGSLRFDPILRSLHPRVFVSAPSRAEP